MGKVDMVTRATPVAPSSCHRHFGRDMAMAEMGFFPLGPARSEVIKCALLYAHPCAWECTSL